MNKVFADGTVADPGAHKVNPDLYVDVSKSVWDDDGDLEVDVNKGSKFAAPAQVGLIKMVRLHSVHTHTHTHTQMTLVRFKHFG